MGFTRIIKNIFGFGPDIDPETETATEPGTRVTAQAPQIDLNQPMSTTPASVGMIFDRVLTVFNDSLPEFLQKSADSEKQKLYLYEALDQSMKDYIASLETEAQARCEEAWEQEREKLRGEAEALKQRTKELEQKRAEIHEKQLSADRQKRALSERVHDLEMKVINLEAEKEQYQLESKGLINKAKVVQVYEKEIADLKEELQDLRKHSANAAPANPDQESCENLRKETEALKTKIASLETEAEALRQDNKKLSDACNTAKLKDEMGGAMLNDLQAQASEAIQASKESDKRLAEIQEILNQKEKLIDSLKKTVAAHESQLAENEETIAEIDDIMEQVQKFEEVKARLESKAAKLRTELNEVKKENESLRTTIKNNLYIQAKQEKAMKDEIANLRTVQADTNTIDTENRPTNVEKAKAFEYPSLFETFGDTGVIKETDPNDSPHTDDLIADTGWIKE